MGRAALGALAGAFSGTILWLGIETISGRSLVWLVLLVGVLAGLGVRCLCQQRNSTTGVIATSMALLGIIGGPLAQPFLLDLIYDATSKSVPAVIKTHDVDDSADVATDESADKSPNESTDISPNKSTDDATPSTPSTDDAAIDTRSASTESILAADARRQSTTYYVGQATGVGQSGASQVLELVMYVISAILAYMLGAGSKKPAAAAPATGSTEPAN